MKLADVRSSTYIDFDKEYNTKNSEFKVGDHVRKSKYKNTFEEFVIKKVKKYCFVDACNRRSCW